MNQSQKDINATLRALTEGRVDVVTAAASLSAVVLMAEANGRDAGIREAANVLLQIAHTEAREGQIRQANTIGAIATKIAGMARRLEVEVPRDAFTWAEPKARGGQRP